MDSDDWFSLRELTGRLGGLVWVEDRLAEVLGAWSKIESHAPAAIAFATTAGHHGWHAEIVRRCMPTSSRLAPDVAVRAPSPGWESAIDTLHSLTDPQATTVRLRTMVKIIDPWLSRETGALVELARPVSDAPMIRWLRFVTIDHGDDGQTMVELLAARAHEAVRFDDHLVLGEIDLASERR